MIVDWMLADLFSIMIQRYRDARSLRRGKFILRIRVVSREFPGVFLIFIYSSCEA